MAADLAGAPAGLDLIQRVILPSEHDPDIVPLYVDADYWTSIPVAPEKRRRSPLRVVDSDTHNAVVRLSDMGIISAIRGDRGFQVPHRRKVSFGTYFNAFPASYWRASTTLDGVVLEVETSGEGQVIVYRSNARGVIQKVDGAAVTGSTTSRFELPFTYFADGGWYWFDLMGEEADFALVEAGWYAPAGSAPTAGAAGSVSIAITTLNRAEYCVKLLTDIGEKPDVAALLDHVYVTDQGTQKVADQPAFPRAQELLGEKLRVIDQANLGGSGGFSRGMYETLKEGASDYVLVMDDDITLEPESIRRAVKFADYARTPTIVGGHMFDMYDKSKLHAYAEGFDMWNFMWGPVTPTRHDFSASNLRQTRWMHRRVDAEYNGWWMCLIPVSTIKQVGLSLPVFIKWDDAEYALRAKEVGVPTVTLPGAAVWHVSWVDKDDSQDWQAFFHARNRLIAALLHSPYERGGRFLTANLATDVRHLVSMRTSRSPPATRRTGTSSAGRAACTRTWSRASPAPASWRRGSPTASRSRTVPPCPRSSRRTSRSVDAGEEPPRASPAWCGWPGPWPATRSPRSARPRPAGRRRTWRSRTPAGGSSPRSTACSSPTRRGRRRSCTAGIPCSSAACCGRASCSAGASSPAGRSSRPRTARPCPRSRARRPGPARSASTSRRPAAGRSSQPRIRRPLSAEGVRSAPRCGGRPFVCENRISRHGDAGGRICSTTGWTRCGARADAHG